MKKQKPHQTKNQNTIQEPSWIELLKLEFEMLQQQSNEAFEKISLHGGLHALPAEDEVFRVKVKARVARLGETLLAIRQDSGSRNIKTIENSLVSWRKGLDLDFDSFAASSLSTEHLMGRIQKHIENLRKQFGFLPAKARYCLLPDTNVFVRQPQVAHYKRHLDGAESFSVFLLPTVFEELDKQKSHDKTSSYKEKLRKTGNQFKEYASRGKLSDGVKVQGDIYFGAVAHNPVFTNALSWLDPNHMDDRLVASAVNFQIQHPEYHVILLTADMGPYIKCEMLRFPCIFLSPDDLDPISIPQEA